jgi:hypothetical protein
MCAAVLDPPTTTDELRSRATELADGVAEALERGPGDRPDEQERAQDARLARRQEFFTDIRAAVRNLTASPAWRKHDLTTELLLLMERLRDEIESDSDGTDPEWRVREVLQRAVVVLRAMVRQLEHNELDRPEQAAAFIAQALSEVEVGQVAALLDTTPRMVANYRNGEVGALRKNPARVTLIAQLVYELLGSMTERGALLWFDARVLDGRTPRELIDADPATYRQPLMTLARGGRAQTDQGGTLVAPPARGA